MHRRAWIAATIIAAGILLAVLIPNGRYCNEGGRSRGWSYTFDKWFTACGVNEVHPMDAEVDDRLPLRIGLVAGAVLVTWGLALSRRGDQSRPGRELPDWFVVTVFGVVGAILAFVVSIRQESRCILPAPGELICEYKSFLGWDTAPLIVDALWTILGAVLGTAAGVVVARLTREPMQHPVMPTMEG